MATKTLTLVGGTTDDSINMANGGEGYQQIKSSHGTFSWGYLVFDLAELANKPSATYISGVNLSYNYYLNNDGLQAFGITVEATDHVFVSLLNGSISNKSASITQEAVIKSSTKLGDYSTQKNTGWLTRSGGTANLSISGAPSPRGYKYLGIMLSTTENNSSTHMTAKIKNPQVTIVYTERYTATFNEDKDGKTTQQIVNNGSAASFYKPTADGSRQYYTFKGWKSSLNGQIYTETLPNVTDTDVTYTAQWERNTNTISWNLDGGFDETANTSTPSSITVNQGDSWIQQGHIITKPGYKFIGWDQSYNGGLIAVDGYRGYTTSTSTEWQKSTNADNSTKYKLSITKTASDYWKWIRFGSYTVNPNQEIIIRGQIRLINMPINIKFYHGEKPNDYSNSKLDLNNNSIKNEWQRFEIKRSNFSSSLTTGCFELYTGNLNNISGTLEFDLREVEIISQGQNICPLLTNTITSNVTFKALYREKNYVAYDSYFNYKQFRDLRLGSTANGGSISNITDTGFTMTSTSGDCYTQPFSPMFYLEKDKDYIISFETDDTSNCNVFTFYYDTDGADLYNYSLSPNSKAFSGSGRHEFTFKAKSPYCRFRAGTTVNGNVVNFRNFCVRPAGDTYNYMNTIAAAERCNVEATLTFPVPTREHYTLKGWNTKIDGSGTSYNSSSKFPTKNLTLWSQWEIDKHKATFLNYDGSVFKTIDVPYGSTPNISDIPTKPDSERYHYDFSHWENLGPILGDTIYNPVFTPRTRYYKIIWQNYDGTKLEEDSLPYEEIPVYDYSGGVPTKPATAQYTYTWAGWNIEIAPVTADITYTAVYTHTTNTYDVTWKNWDGTVLKVDEDIPYGDVPVFDYDLPTKESTAKYSYTFFDWDATPGDDSPSGVESVKGHITYTAVYTATIRSYSLNLNTSEENSGSLQGDGVYEYGSAVAITTFPKPGYAFIGWSDGVKDRTRIVEITGESTYTAIYKKIGIYLNTIPIKEVYLDTINITDSIHILPDLNII